MADSTPDLSREERINGVVADFLDAVQAGKKPDPREVLANHPDLAAELRTFFAAHRDVVGDVPPPERFGDYEILAEIGRGGMGVVYKARHVTLHRLAAVKMILAGAFAGEQERRRFLTEAAALARLEHPHVVHLYEFGEHGGQPWFALEFVEGGSLAQQLGGTPQPPRQAAEIVEKLARGTRAARIDTPARNPVELRRAVAQCFARVDVREKTSWKMPRGLDREPVQADRLVFSPDGKRLAIAQQLGTIRRFVLVVDVPSGKEIATLTYGGPVAIDAAGTGGGSLAFSPDGRWLVLGTGQGEIYAWDSRRLEGAKPVHWTAHQKCVTGLAFPPLDRALLSCSEDGWLKCWAVPDGGPQARPAPWPARQPAQRCDWSFCSRTSSNRSRTSSSRSRTSSSSNSSCRTSSSSSNSSRIN